MLSRLRMLKKIEIYLAMGFIAAFFTLSILHIFTGYADNGDFTRNCEFLFEKPDGFSLMWPSANTIEWHRRFFSLWHDKWIFLENWPNIDTLPQYTSYPLYLFLQAKLSSLLTLDSSRYSIILGSLISRVILFITIVSLLYHMRKHSSLWVFWGFSLLAALVFLDSNWLAFLNSFYEEQMAIIFLPVIALLFCKYYRTRSVTLGFLLLITITIVACAKTLYFYFPLLIAPFLYPFCRGKFANVTFLLLIVGCQSIAFMAVTTGKYQKFNAYNALYFGTLKGLNSEEVKAMSFIGNKPVLPQCVGISPYSQKGHECLVKANASYEDTLRLLSKHPTLGLKMLSQALAKGQNVNIDYLKKNRAEGLHFSELPIFNVLPIIFAQGLNVWMCFLLLVVLVVLMKGKTLALRVKSPLTIGLFFTCVGLSQYIAVLGDGFYEINKHLSIANYTFALSGMFILPVLLELLALRYGSCHKPAHPRKNISEWFSVSLNLSRH